MNILRDFLLYNSYSRRLGLIPALQPEMFGPANLPTIHCSQYFKKKVRMYIVPFSFTPKHDKNTHDRFENLSTQNQVIVTSSRNSMAKHIKDHLKVFAKKGIVAIEKINVA